jgi:hypothetical protein
MTAKQPSPISEAERQIAKILCALEKDTGQVVESVNINDIEITSIGDDRQQFQRSISIEVKRLPGTHW